MSYAVFEVSWEVCNKVGGIHTVVSSKAPTLVGRLGDDYVAVGPLLGLDWPGRIPFEEEAGFDDFRDACREAGVEVRVGRWRIGGRPRTLLVGFGGLFEKKDGILAGLWEHFGVDSLFGTWDYMEPVLFSHAAGIAIERWWHEYVAPRRARAVAQFHEWMTGAGLLYLKEHEPAIGTVFTTHATMLGRSIASTGVAPIPGLAGRSPEEAAIAAGVRAKHSMEGVAAREADVFTTVSHVTAQEAARFHRRGPTPLLPNGLDLGVVDALAGAADAEEARRRLARVAAALLGEDVSDAFFVAISGRYEMHNKGIDLLLRALARLAARPGRRVVAFLLIPAGASGVRREVKERLAADGGPGGGPLGLSTHVLFEAERDPVARLAGELGLTNGPGSRVKLVHLPVYLDGADGLLDLPHETALKGMDQTCYPSFYEPWGYTPAESLAVGVPTVSTDCAGFGQWAREQGLRPEDGLHVLSRADRTEAEAAADLERILAGRIERAVDPARVAEACRRAAARLSWSDLIAHYEEAFGLAVDAARTRVAREPLAPQRRKVPVTVQPQEAAVKPRLVAFEVAPVLPEALSPLARLAANYWWCWNPEAAALFEDLDPGTWRAVRGNPVLLLRRASDEALAAAAASAGYLARLAQVMAAFDAYLLRVPSDEEDLEVDVGAARPIAYFCLEYMVHESLPIYAGGLGGLAGDHLKAASDRGLPFVAVGLLYRQGYAEQILGPKGEQLSLPADVDPARLPLTLVRNAEGAPLEVDVRLPNSTILLQAWRADVGRVPLYLLDADVPRNRPADRSLTARLYTGDRELRLLQETLLGKGGVRLLRALRLDPAVFHLNEGHAAFAALERASHLVHEGGLTYDEASEVVRASTAFTTHTPVPAGHDVFTEDLMRRYYAHTATWVGIPWDRFMALGRAAGEDRGFNLTYLSLSLAAAANGVSRKHAEVSRALLQPYFPGLLADEVPVGHVTNGVHLSTWTHPAVARALGVEGRPIGPEDFRTGARTASAEGLWAARKAARRDLLAEIAWRLERGAEVREDSPRRLGRMARGLDPDACWVVFARRFSPYKRATLLLREKERLRRLLTDDERPVRLVYAGKAHPEDGAGQEMIRQIVDLSREEDFLGRLFFVENYDMALARALVQGADVWLNHPRPPLEASGTSGMKAAANGGLNLSVLDGWWIEGYDGENGWAVGAREVHTGPEVGDAYDAATILNVLEEGVVPLFFDRDAAGIPVAWVERMRCSMETIPPRFSAARMLEEYARKAYAPLATAFHQLSADGHALARERAARHHRLAVGMQAVRIVATRVGDLAALRAGDALEVEVDVHLGPLSPGDVEVELVLGTTTADGTWQGNLVVTLRDRGPGPEGTWRYDGRWRLDVAGAWAWGVRVRPRGSPTRFHRDVRWA